ncbi:MAG: PLP-dependent aminotransferase family protein [Clostridium sp.]
MEQQYAKRMSNVKASEIRELLKLTEQPEIISFAGGLPAPELFPIEKLEKVMIKVLREQGQAALQYSSTEGYAPLREIIANKIMKYSGVQCEPSNIMITSGSQQGLAFSAAIFINEGDIIACESPSYLGAINAFKLYGPKFIEIPTDKDGMIVDELERLLKEETIKMIYTIPDFQNPSGITMSLERRKKVAELALKYKIPVIEDSPYGQLRFEGENLPSIKSFDTEGYVINLGTFSKTFCPGLRIGWVCADNDVLQKYIQLKQGQDLQCASINQMATARFLTEYSLDEHVNCIIDVYRKRRDIMLEEMKLNFPKEVTYTYPEGGLFTWVEVKEGLNALDIAKEALKENVAFVPGNSFYPNGNDTRHFRLNYSNMNEEKIREGIRRLGKVLKKFY